jgi:hypothetical protein
MTDLQRIALLRRALHGLLALVDERGAAAGSGHIDARISRARRAIAMTAPTTEKGPGGQPTDYPDFPNDLSIASKQLNAFTEIIERMNEAFAKAIITKRGAKRSPAVAESLVDFTADVPALMLFEVRVMDKVANDSTRHFAWTRAEVLAAAARRAEELISQRHRHPSDVHTSEVSECSLALTRDGILKLLHDQCGDLS